MSCHASPLQLTACDRKDIFAQSILPWLTTIYEWKIAVIFCTWTMNSNGILQTCFKAITGKLFQHEHSWRSHNNTHSYLKDSIVNLMLR